MGWRFLGAITFLLLAGCGEKVPFGVAPVHGKVIYEDGSPIKAHRITISFISQIPPKGKDSPRMGNAELGPDGSYSNVTTWNPHDGVIVGKQKVIVRAVDAREIPSPAVPPEYGDPVKTPLVIDVPSGGGELPPLKIPKPK